MQKLSNQEKIRPWMGFALFAFIMVFFLTFGRYIQNKLGIAGVIITEISFLAIAVIFALVSGIKLKEMFPVKKVTARDLFGVGFLHLAGILFSYISLGIVGTLIPSSLKDIDRLNDFLFGNLSLIPALIIVGLLPAVCEEAIHRGAILSCFRSIKKDWVIVLIMALFFGINHVSLIKFFSTALLGGVMSYILVKKNNILLTMLMHFVNNAFSVFAGFKSGAAGGQSIFANGGMIKYLGIYLIMGFAAPVFLVIGSMLLKPEEHKKSRFKIAGICSFIILAAGVFFTKKFFFGDYMNTSVSMEIKADQSEYEVGGFDIDEEKTCMIVIQLEGAEGDYRVRIDGDKGSNIINAPVPEDGKKTVWYQPLFWEDHYTVYVVPEDNAVGESPTFRIVIQ